MRGGVYEMSISYDVLVAAVRKALSGYSRSWINEALDEETLTGCTVFKFSHRESGDDLGEVQVRKLSEGRSELSTRGPRRLSSRDLTQEEKDALKAIPDKDERLLQELYLRSKREEHFDRVIQTMFNRLYHDKALWRALQVEGNTKRKGAPRLEERADVEEKRRKAREYLDRINKGTSKQLAADFVGHARKTLDRWVERLL